MIDNDRVHLATILAMTVSLLTSVSDQLCQVNAFDLILFETEDVPQHTLEVSLGENRSQIRLLKRLFVFVAVAVDFSIIDTRKIIFAAHFTSEFVLLAT